MLERGSRNSRLKTLPGDGLSRPAHGARLGKIRQPHQAHIPLIGMIAPPMVDRSAQFDNLIGRQIAREDVGDVGLLGLHCRHHQGRIFFAVVVGKPRILRDFPDQPDHHEHIHHSDDRILVRGVDQRRADIADLSLHRLASNFAGLGVVRDLVIDVRHGGAKPIAEAFQVPLRHIRIDLKQRRLRG